MLLNTTNDPPLAKKTLSYRERKKNNKAKGIVMLVLDPPAILALAALVTSISSLVWALRRSRR